MIKRTIHIQNLLLFIFLILFNLPIYPQDDDKVEVKISSNKVIIGGTVYYVHMVQKGQTLYAISKAYGISEEEIVKENPGADITLKEGQALKIPAKVKYKEVELKEKDKYIYHIIQAGQTLYSLSKKYDVSIAEIEKHNPEVKYDSLQVNQVIKIPRKTSPEHEPTDTNYIYYEVKKRETLYFLSRRFNVTEEQIKNANEELTYSILKEGQIIRIPQPFIPQPEITQRPADTSIKPLVYRHDTLIDYDSLMAYCDSFHYEENPIAFNIAVMLPFCNRQRMELKNSTEIYEDELQEFYHARKLKTLESLAYSFGEFYEGLLLAAKRLKQKGVILNLHVYDTEKDTSKVKELVNKHRIDTMDLLIGPVYGSCLRVLLDSNFIASANIVSPLCHEIPMYSNNYVFVVNPPLSIIYESIINKIVEDTINNLIVLYSGDKNSLKQLECFKEKCKHHLPDTMIIPVMNNDTIQHTIYQALNKHSRNQLLVLTEEEMYLSRIIAKFNLISTRYDITVYGFPSWTTFVSIDEEFYHDLELIYATPFYVDFESENVQSYQYEYLNYFNSIPYLTTSEGYGYSYMGYDIMYYFGTALKEYGRYFPYCITDLEVSQLTSAFDFQRDTLTGCYYNHGLSYIQYTQEYSIVKLDSTAKGLFIPEKPDNIIDQIDP